MILTEEELNEIETIYGLHIDGGHRNYESIVKLIASHRSLLSANAELSFKNIKLKEAYETCGNGCNSLASVLVGWKLPNGWHDWTYEEASTYFYGIHSDDHDTGYEKYEVWLCWKAFREADQKLEELK